MAPEGQPGFNSSRLNSVVLVLRHAQSLANAAWLSGEAPPASVDTPLSAEGEREALGLRAVVQEFHPDFLVTSPLKRALRTAELCSSTRWPVYLHAALQEHVTGPGDVVESDGVMFTKNSLIRPACRFGIISAGGNEYSEPVESLDERITHFSGWLKRLPSARVVVIGHRAYLHRWLDRDFSNCESVQFAITTLLSRKNGGASPCPTCGT